MNESVVVIGAGGHAASVAEVIASAGRRVLAFVDDAPVGSVETTISQSKYESDPELAAAPAIVAIGNNCTRRRVQLNLMNVAPAVVASTATVSDSGLAVGTVIHHHAHVGPRSSIGVGCIVNTGAIVEHDCQVAEFAHVAPGAILLGGVVVGAGAFIGARAVVLPGLVVGANAIVGAGAVVTANVSGSSTVIGVPARPVN